MPDQPTFARSRPVVMVPYRPAWALEFAALAHRLHQAVGIPLSDIDHIGSTAVPGLCAKDVLDVQLRVPHLAEAAALTQRLRAVGFQRGEPVLYDCFGGMPADAPGLAKYYLREPPGERRVHLHVRETGRFNARFALLFRDYLCAKPAARDQYGELKLRAATLFPDSIDGYLFLKEPVFHLLHQAAELWAEKVGWPTNAINECNRSMIDKIAWLHLRDGAVLSTRSQGKDRYYFPGGKREPGETDQQTLLREIKEELTVDLDPASLRYAGTFEAPAHGHPTGVLVRMTCYYAAYAGTIQPAAEIAEVAWLSYRHRPQVSAVDQLIFDWLRAQQQLAD